MEWKTSLIYFSKILLHVVAEEATNSWMEQFIGLIRERPAIYGNNLPAHSTRQVVQKAWEEVCQQIVAGWETHTASEQETEGKIICNFRLCS